MLSGIRICLDHKKASRDFSLLGVAAGSLEAFCAGFLEVQHVTLTNRRPALPVGEAERKGEIIK
jgi:hypothetical protein